MGKRSRRREREQSASIPPIDSHADAPLGNLHITVATIATAAELDRSHETQLVKAALLHADRVTLASAKALMLASLAAFGTGSRQERIDQMASIMEGLDQGQEFAQVYEQLRSRRRYLSPPERATLLALERILDHSSHEFSGEVDTMLDQAGAQELGKAIAANGRSSTWQSSAWQSYWRTPCRPQPARCHCSTTRQATSCARWSRKAS